MTVRDGRVDEQAAERQYRPVTASLLLHALVSALYTSAGAAQ